MTGQDIAASLAPLGCPRATTAHPHPAGHRAVVTDAEGGRRMITRRDIAA